MKLLFLVAIAAAASACTPTPAAPTEPTELEPPHPTSQTAAPVETTPPAAPLPSAAPSAPPTSTVAATPSSAPSVPSKPHPRPSLDTKCSTTKDCEAFMPGIPGSDVCCPGCVWTPASTSSLARLRADCNASPPEMCPPLGCAAQPSHAECKANRCVIVPDK